jgi:uncharacterized protein YeaO (DUF488 family)
MVIKTKSIFQPRVEDDGIRILISRFYPRGIERTHFHEWALSLSPSPELLFSYKRGNRNWSSFKRMFIAELKRNIESLDTIGTLNEIGQNRDITLLCYEQSGVACHRHIVRDIIETPKLLEP